MIGASLISEPTSKHVFLVWLRWGTAHAATVGPNGVVKANVTAKGVIVQGKLDGSISASDRVELRQSAVVTGDLATQRISIEEGAFLKGKARALAPRQGHIPRPFLRRRTGRRMIGA